MDLSWIRRGRTARRAPDRRGAGRRNAGRRNVNGQDASRLRASRPDIHLGNHRFDQPEARRQTTFAHRGDKFKTVRTRLRCKPGVGNGRGDHFE